MLKPIQLLQPDISGLLGVGSHFEGLIRFDGSLRIDGKMVGDLFCKSDELSTIIITEKAEVEANIIADVVIVAGKVSGNIKAIQRLEVIAPGRVEGLVYTSDLSIADGALFQGECIMIRQLSEQEKQSFKMEGFYQIHHSRMLQNHRHSIHEPIPAQEPIPTPTP